MQCMYRCHYCGSEKRSPRQSCSICHDLDARDYLAHEAKLEFIAGRIDVDELEERIWAALTGPVPSAPWGPGVVMLL